MRVPRDAFSLRLKKLAAERSQGPDPGSGTQPKNPTNPIGIANQNTVKILTKIDDLVEIAEKVLIVVLFAGLVGLFCFNILSRNLFQVSFQKIPAVTPALVLWLALCGSTLALKKNRHIRLELLMRYCRPGLRRAAGVAVSLFGMAVMGVLFFAAVAFVGNEVAIFGPAGWPAVIFPLFFGLSFFRYLVQFAAGLGSHHPPAVDP